MEKKLSKYQRSLIRKHNAEVRIIAATSQATGISGATLYYCARFGIMGIPYSKPSPSHQTITT